MARIAQVRWEEIRQDYIRDTTLTQSACAKKWGITFNQLRNKAWRENWARARENYAAEYAERLEQLSIRSDAPQLLKALNEKTLKQSEELRVMLNMKLKIKDQAGKIVVRPDVTIIEIRCTVAAFAELYRMDRLALGAATDLLSPATTQSRYDDLTEEELIGELRQVRKRVAIN